MAHIYELGYGTYEESEFAQLQHRRKFTQSRFEKMVLDCTVQAALMELVVHKKQWSEDLSACHVKGNDTESFESSELISGRKSSLESAMRWRLSGDEGMYLYSLKDAYFMDNPSLTYQSLHKLVVWLMCEKYGFKPVEKLRTACFFGWSDLSVQDDWSQDVAKDSLTARASRLVRKLVFKKSNNSDNEKWITSRESAIHKNPVAFENEDKALCDELGVEFIPYNHKDAIKARDEIEQNKF